MRDCLAGVVSAVENSSKPAAGDPKLGGQVLSGEKQFLKQMALFPANIQNVANVLLWNNQKVHRCLGSYILEGKDMFIFKNFFAGQSALSDLAKDTFLGLFWIVWSHFCLRACGPFALRASLSLAGAHCQP